MNTISFSNRNIFTKSNTGRYFFTTCALLVILSAITGCMLIPTQPETPPTTVEPQKPAVMSEQDFINTIPHEVHTTTQKLSLGSGAVFGAEWTVTAEAVHPAYIEQVTPQLTKEAGIDGVSYGVSFNFKYIGTKSSSISCSATVAENTYICFSLKSDISASYDGNLVFYVDGTPCLTASGTDNIWRKYIIPLEKDSRTLEWKAEGASDSYTVNHTNTVCLDDICFMHAEPITSMIETFDTFDLSAFPWTTEGTLVEVTWDEFLQDWIDKGSVGLMNADNHGYVAKIGTMNEVSGKNGSSYLVLPQVAPEKMSALSFEYKMQLAPDKSVYAAVYIDGKEALRINPEDYASTPWKKATVPVPAGKHSIKIGAVTENGLFISGDAKNCILIDNISLVPDETVYTTVYPKGLQETYEGGLKLQFTASAKRLDGSVKKNTNVKWSASNDGVITADGVFTPTKAGIFTISATIDGKTAYNEKIVVHPKDYINRTFTYNGATYGGLTNISGKRHDTGTVIFGENTPDGDSFDANGFFVLSGKVTNPSAQNYAFVSVEKMDNPSLTTHYTIQGNFSQRIWLRFGKGNYKINVMDLTSVTIAGETGGKGDIEGFSVTTANAMTFTVRNTADTKGAQTDDARWLFPSDECQSDDFRVMNLANAILAEIGYDAPVTEKLRAIHNWITLNLSYDVTSRDYPAKRLKQDAVTVIGNKKGVCEGYTNLFISLERYMGIEGKTISSSQMNHAWNNTLLDGKWYLVDVTWDDPVSEYGETERELYTYFLTDLTGKDNDHPADAIDKDSNKVFF
ncbi:MAG: hypothetical protein K5751_05570 [Treponemataceae bacterium]|nr:hypothetical protein [Treponemataceae bacterium]